MSVGSPEVKVGFAEGVGHGAAGGVFSLGDALSSSWTTHFQQADGEWILPHLERMAQGEVVEESELVAAFTERHGRAPEAYETKR